MLTGTQPSEYLDDLRFDTRQFRPGRFTVLRCYFFLEEAAAIRAALRRSAAMDAATDEFE